MREFKREHGSTVIPKGCYCYGANAELCPYWDWIDDADEQNNGYCWFMEEADDEYGGLLWDQIKECGISDPDDWGFYGE